MYDEGICQTVALVALEIPLRISAKLLDGVDAFQRLLIRVLQTSEMDVKTIKVMPVVPQVSLQSASGRDATEFG